LDFAFLKSKKSHSLSVFPLTQNKFFCDAHWIMEFN
jgi:hypothetical protein